MRETLQCQPNLQSSEAGAGGPMAKLIHVVVGWRSQLLTIVGLLTTQQLAFLRRDDLMVDGVGGGGGEGREPGGRRGEEREERASWRVRSHSVFYPLIPEVMYHHFG